MRTKREWSERARRVARWFEVDVSKMNYDLAQVDSPAVNLSAGKIILLSGGSGGGKSTLLRRIRRRCGRGVAWIDLGRIVLPRASVIDVMVDAMGGGDDEASIVAGLEALSRVGLGEVWSYLRWPGELSEGQRWRLRLAMGIACGNKPYSQLPRRFTRASKLTVLAADEFAAPLDRVTALVVARALRKAVSAHPNLCAIVATTRDDLVHALSPDLHVQCDFGNDEILNTEVGYEKR